MYHYATLLSASLFAFAKGQQVGTELPETHPPLTWSKCTTSGGCATQSGEVVLDSNWRWLHTTTDKTKCYSGNAWDTTICTDPVTCAAKCALDGAAYATTYGVTTSDNSITLELITAGNVGSRNYLMSSATEYEIFKPLNQEFTFTVDASKLPCGINGALYFVEMAADGGMASFPSNKAGAKHGTGYCDSQCPRDLKFIDGTANLIGWNAGNGKYGTCCNEMDIWEANSVSSAFTPHPCNSNGLAKCDSTTSECTSICDKAGCDFNPYRMGNRNFYGPGKTVDTTKPIQVVTQFITSDGTDTGKLTEIRRLYVQDGVTIQNANTNLPGMGVYNSISDAFCSAQKATVGDPNAFATHGGLAGMGQALGRGMVLVLSIWDDYAAQMLWLDSDYPVGANPANPGVSRGPCPTDSGLPSAVEAAGVGSVVFSDLRFGDIGSTYTGKPYKAPGRAAKARLVETL